MRIYHLGVREQTEVWSAATVCRMHLEGKTGDMTIPDRNVCSASVWSWAAASVHQSTCTHEDTVAKTVTMASSL